MLPDQVSNPEPLTYESGALPIALRGPELKESNSYLFVKFSCSICIFLSSANLICRSTDISKCFRGSLRLRDNES